MTQEQQKRVISATIDTQRALDKEMQYSPSVRDHKLVAFYEAHLVKLAAMLA